MAQTAEKLSDYYQHVCTYFSVTQKDIDNLSNEIKEDLIKYLGPLKRPFKTVEQFKSEKASEEQDIIVKVLGISPLISYTSKKGNGYYQRLLGADSTGELEFTTFQVNKHEVGDNVRITGIHYFTSNEGREQIRISRSGGIFNVPFELDQMKVSQQIFKPDDIDFEHLPSNHVTLKAILLEKGEIEVRKEKYGSGSYSSIKIVVCSKEKKLLIYAQRQLATDISKNINVSDVVLFTNVILKPSRGQIVGYASNYSAYQNKPLDNYEAPKNLGFLYIPIQKTDLVTLRQNSFLIGKVKGLITDPVKFEGKYGDYYAAGFVDNSASGSITFNEDTVKLLPKSKTFLQQITIEGLVHSNKDYYKLVQNRGKTSKNAEAIAIATINGAEVLEMEGIFCIAGKFVESFDPKEFTTKDGRTDTMQRVKFDCQGHYYNITAFNKEDRAKLYELKLNNTYEILFTRKEIYNDFVSLRFTSFTIFRLLEEGEEQESESLDNDLDESENEDYTVEPEELPDQPQDPLDDFWGKKL